MLLIIMRANRLSNCRATSRTAAGSLRAAPDLSFSSPAKSPYTLALLTGVVAMAAASDDDELSAQRAGLLQRLEDGDQVAGSGAHLVDGAHDLIERNARLEDEHAGIRLLHVDAALGRDHGLTLGERRRLAHVVALGDGHRERAVGDGRGGDAHVRADDHRAGARVHDDASRGLAGLDL